MAADTTLKGLNRTKWDVTVPSVKIGPGDQEGSLHALYDQYTYAEASEVGDIITMMKIPAGARVHDVIVYSDDQGTAGQWDVGYAASADAVEAADDDAFFNEFNPESANVASMSGGGVAAGTGSGSVAQAGVFKQFSSAVDLQWKCTEASTATAFTIKCQVIYSL